MPLPNLFMALEERVQVFNKFVGILQTTTPVTPVLISRRAAKTQRMNYKGCLHPMVKTKTRPRGLNLDLTPLI
jgi:hypothetical protein